MDLGDPRMRLTHVSTCALMDHFAWLLEAVALGAEFENYVMMMPEVVQTRRYDFAKFKCCLHVRLIGAGRKSWNNGLIIDLDHRELLTAPSLTRSSGSWSPGQKRISWLCPRPSSWCVQKPPRLFPECSRSSPIYPGRGGQDQYHHHHQMVFICLLFPNPALIISATKPWPYRNQRPGVNNPCVYFGHEEGETHTLSEWESAWCTIHIWQMVSQGLSWLCTKQHRVPHTP